MRRNFLLLFFFLVLSCSSKNIQNETLELRLIEAEIDFLSFYSLNSGQAKFYENITDNYNAGYRYRVFTSLYGIYCVVFIDKISLNVEGGYNELLWFRKLDLGALYSRYSFHEEVDCFNFLEWTENNKFLFRIRERKFLGEIDENGEWLEVRSL